MDEQSQSLVLEPELYQPSQNTDGQYLDYLPPTYSFKNGLKCPCGARKSHVFETRYNFNIHIKSKTHQKWLSDLNMNKTSHMTECESLKELVNSQKLIIARLERELNLKMKTIDYLTQQLMNRDAAAANTPNYNLLDLDV
jgi:hypothetical protein